LRFTKLFAPTTKDAPKDATLPSHIYLVKGGFVSQIGSGIYNFLPLGKMVLDNIRSIVKEELDKVGAQEVQLGFITPSDLWVESGRYSKFGKELLRFKDRKNNEFVLGPTHEEAMVDLVRSRVKSYKHLPLNLYQINTKFRDEARPRYGLLRGREFLMKDGYSFHEDEEDLIREFNLMQKTYSKILDRLGLDYRVVEADSGAIGGSGSRELMVLADNGEDDIVVCSSCEYSANIEAAKKIDSFEVDSEVEMTPGKFHTPDVSSIDELSEFFKIGKEYLVKAVAKKAIYEDKEQIVLFFIRGDDELQEVKAQNACGALEMEDVTKEELESAGISVGFMGLVSKKENFYVDESLRDRDPMICGGDEVDHHFVGFSFKDKDYEYADLVSVKEGDKCISCSQNLSITKGIEVGHIFQLGTSYSESLKATFLDRDGKSKPLVMGTYGIGVSRLVAVMIEQHHDDRGCIWSESTTPFKFEIIISNIKDDEQKEFGEELYAKMSERGMSVLLDDRAERFGFKIGDFELLGFPYAIIVGKGLKDGEVQLVDRKTLEKQSVKKDEIFDKIKGL
jgi:prolyl-tRNA synthetase